MGHMMAALIRRDHSTQYSLHMTELTKLLQCIGASAYVHSVSLASRLLSLESDSHFLSHAFSHNSQGEVMTTAITSVPRHF